MLPPLHGRSPRPSRDKISWRSPRQVDLSSPRGANSASRASSCCSRGTSIYSVDREVWSINRTPAPPSEASFAYASDCAESRRSSTRSQSGSLNDRLAEMKPEQRFVYQAMDKPTTMKPAPYRQRFASAERQRRLDERRDKWLERHRLARQQREIEELEFQIALQEKQKQLQVEDAMKENEIIQRVNNTNADEFKEHRRQQGLLELLRDRHLAAGNREQVQQLSMAMQGHRRNGHRKHRRIINPSMHQIFGQMKVRKDVGIRKNRVRYDPSRADSNIRNNSVRSLR